MSQLQPLELFVTTAVTFVTNADFVASGVSDRKDRSTRPGFTRARACALVSPHVPDPNAHGPQAGECLERVEVLVAVAAVTAVRVALDRADQPDLLV
jgi:hypothetical protein